MLRAALGSSQRLRGLNHEYMAQPGGLRRPLRGADRKEDRTAKQPNSRADRIGLTQANRPPRKPVRFNDVFHLAYAAVLGWSPVVRKLLRRKRKSDPLVDEVEDGGRAGVVEEAISIFVFNEAAKRGWFADETSIDIGLLKTIIRLTTGLEVQRCTAKQWKSAILQGYGAFRSLKQHRGGRIDVDLDKQTVAYAPLNPSEAGNAL
jgi:hypothetical protein